MSRKSALLQSLARDGPGAWLTYEPVPVNEDMRKKALLLFDGKKGLAESPTYTKVQRRYYKWCAAETTATAKKKKLRDGDNELWALQHGLLSVSLILKFVESLFPEKTGNNGGSDNDDINGEDGFARVVNPESFRVYNYAMDCGRRRQQYYVTNELARTDVRAKDRKTLEAILAELQKDLPTQHIQGYTFRDMLKNMHQDKYNKFVEEHKAIISLDKQRQMVQVSERDYARLVSFAMSRGYFALGTVMLIGGTSGCRSQVSYNLKFEDLVHGMSEFASLVRPYDVHNLEALTLMTLRSRAHKTGLARFHFATVNMNPMLDAVGMLGMLLIDSIDVSKKVKLAITFEDQQKWLKTRVIPEGRKPGTTFSRRGLGYHWDNICELAGVQTPSKTLSLGRTYFQQLQEEYGVVHNTIDQATQRAVKSVEHYMLKAKKQCLAVSSGAGRVPYINFTSEVVVPDDVLKPFLASLGLKKKAKEAKQRLETDPSDKPARLVAALVITLQQVVAQALRNIAGYHFEERFPGLSLWKHKGFRTRAWGEFKAFLAKYNLERLQAMEASHRQGQRLQPQRVHPVKGLVPLLPQPAADVTTSTTASADASTESNEPSTAEESAEEGDKMDMDELAPVLVPALALAPVPARAIAPKALTVDEQTRQFQMLKTVRSFDELYAEWYVGVGASANWFDRGTDCKPSVMYADYHYGPAWRKPVDGVKLKQKVTYWRRKRAIEMVDELAVLAFPDTSITQSRVKVVQMLDEYIAAKPGERTCAKTIDEMFACKSAEEFLKRVLHKRVDELPDSTTKVNF